MSDRLAILNRLIDIEDEIQSKLDEELKQRVQNKIVEEFGEAGLNVCGVYYKNDNTLNTSDCPECAEKSKLLIQQMQTANVISQSMTDSQFLNTYFKFNDKLKQRIRKRIVWIIKVLVKYLAVNKIAFNGDFLRNLVIALILEYFNEEYKK